MAGFDETVPPDDDPTNEENAVLEDDRTNPAVEHDPTPGERGGAPLGGGDELISGQYGPTEDYGS